MSQARAYLVDFDGTLADTGDANFRAYAQALREVGVIVDRQTFDQEAFGRNWREFLPRFLESASIACSADRVAIRKVELYAECARMIRFNEALINLLRMRDTLTRAAIVTSASASNLSSALAARPDVRDLFDLIVTGDDVRQHKPHPEGYVLAAEIFGVTPSQCIVFEDSDVGVTAGRNFGAQVLRISMRP
jgi:HAD superfamily hydrolase (TIGR01509 family)